MQIRTRLTLQFLLSGGLVIIIASISIYLFSSNFHKRDFHNLLKNKAIGTANLLFNKYEVDESRIKRIENENQINLYDIKIIILNSKKDTVYNSDEKGEIKIDKNVIEKIESGYTITGHQNNNELVGILYFTNYDIFIIFAAASDIEGKLRLEKILKLLITVCFISILLFAVLGWFYSGRALKPISKIVKNMEDISITKLNLRLSEEIKKDEIGRLARTFNKMLERLEIAFATQKQFIANASHELRTPLTSINGHLEVILMKERSVDEYKHEIENVLSDLKSLIQLSNKLLLLASSNAENSFYSNKEIRIDEILWQIKEEFNKNYKEYTINISMDNSLTDFQQMEIIGDEALLRAAISNIIDNACKYSPDHTVFIKFHYNNEHIEIEFEDKGIGIPQESIQKIFQAFYRGNNTTSISGHGIGLALAKQIITNHNGEIKIASELGIGTRISIILPTAK